VGKKQQQQRCCLSMKMGQKKISACVSASFGCMTSKEGAHNVRSRKKRKETTTAQFSNEKPQNKNSFWFKTFFFFNGALVIIFKMNQR
jgi:hypothetical protein